jgi:hypothetical protein
VPATRGTRTGPAQVKPKIIPVKLMDEWVRSLPNNTIPQKLISDEVRYNHALNVGQTLQLSQTYVDKDTVWVFSDIEFYATAPCTAMNAPPKNLNPEALDGVLRIDLKFGGNSPLQTDARRMSPYSTPNQVAATTSGWPWLQTPFGVQRMPSFALYAGAEVSVEVLITVEALPRFPITRIGVNMHGFTIPAGLFNRAWS